MAYTAYPIIASHTQEVAQQASEVRISAFLTALLRRFVCHRSEQRRFVSERGEELRDLFHFPQLFLRRLVRNDKVFELVIVFQQTRVKHSFRVFE